MRRLLELPHHLDDYECMWNGIEDLYMQKTAESLPPSFFFVLAGFGSFCYMKTEKDEYKRLLALGDGRTRKMYEFLAPIVGFTYHFYEHKTFELALAKAKREIDAGFPCVLGALDMRYLPYFEKLYHGESIPFHYVMMVGYDDEARQIFLNDCGRAQTQTLAYDELRLAWDCAYAGLSKPNTVCTIRMNAQKDPYAIAREALALRRRLFRGFEKFISEFPKWKETLSKADYDKLLLKTVTFLGTVPTVPNALRGIDAPDTVAFGGGFDKARVVLEWLGHKYGDVPMLRAAESFGGCAALTASLKDCITSYLTGGEDGVEKMTRLFTQIKERMREGFEALGAEI